MNRNQARVVHKSKFQDVLGEIEEVHSERFSSRYAAYISQILTEEEARAAFQIHSEPEETETYWVIEFWRLIKSRTTPAEISDYTTSLSLGIVYRHNYFQEDSAGTLLTYNQERLEEYRAEAEHIQFFSQFFPSSE